MKINRDQIKHGIAMVVCILGLSSCMHTEDIAIDLSDYQPILVVHCALSPSNKNIELKLTQTIPSTVLNAFEKEDLLVHNAEVMITNTKTAEAIVLTQTNDTLPYYRSANHDFKILVGEEYQLNINADGFVKVQAFTTVPVVYAEWGKTKVRNEQFEFNMGQVFEGSYTLQDTLFSPFVAYVSVNSYDNVNYYRESLFFEYTMLSTNKRLVSIESLSPFVYVNLITPSESMQHYLELEEFYRYHDLWSDVGSFTEIYTGIFPDYTNIENGLGVFGSYLERRITYKLGPYGGK